MLKKKSFFKNYSKFLASNSVYGTPFKTHANKVNKTRQIELTMITEVADANFFFLFQNSVLVISLIFCP